MKTPSAERLPARRGAKGKRQALLLGGLVSVLGVVLIVQFSGTDDAMAATSPSFDTAVESLQESAHRISEAESMVAVPDNAALSSESSANGVVSSPFENFWNVDAPTETSIEEIPVPSITLNCTFTSGREPVAVIDGQTRFVNDMIQGWRLVSIGSREVVLESRAKTVITVEMPLLKLTNRSSP